MFYLAHFFAAVFLVNGIPHFVQGISGNSFQSPFSKPPGKGESSPIVNVLWGTFNFVIGYLLLFGIGNFSIGLNLDTVLFLLASVVTATLLSWYFGKVRKKQNKK